MKTPMFLSIFMLLSVFSANASSTKYAQRVGVAALIGGGTYWMLSSQITSNATRSAGTIGLDYLSTAASKIDLKTIAATSLAAAVIAKDQLAPKAKEAYSAATGVVTKNNAINFTGLVAGAGLVRAALKGDLKLAVGSAALLTAAAHFKDAPEKGRPATPKTSETVLTEGQQA